MDVPQAAPLGLLHHQADGFLITFVIPLHGPEHLGLGADRIQLGCQLPQALRQLVPTLQAGILPEGVAGNGIVGGGHIILGLPQLTAAGIQVCPGSFDPAVAGGQVLTQLLQAGIGLSHAFFQTPDIRFPAGHFGGQAGFLSTQLQKLLGQALGIGGHGRQLLLQALQHPAFLFQGFLDLADANHRLIDLGHDAAAAVLVTL